MNFLDRPMIAAVAAALVAAALAAIGYLVKRWIESRSNLVVYAENFKQIVPLMGEQPQFKRRFKRRPVYCESVKFRVFITHNQKGTQLIHIKRFEFEARPVSISKKEVEALDYRIDTSRLQEFATIDLDEYAFQLSDSKIVGQHTESSKRTLNVDPENIFHSTQGTTPIYLKPQSEPSKQLNFLIEAVTPGLYQSRLQIHYDIGGKPKEQTTSWIYVFQQQSMISVISHTETALRLCYRTPEELQEILELMEKGKLNEAQEKATALVKLAPESFSSIKYERFMRGSALYLLGEIAAKMGDNEDSIRHMEAAADLGHPFAPYQVAARLLIEAAVPNTSLEPRANLDQVFHYYLIGAELGDVVCIDHIQVALRAKGKKSQEHYWFLLKRMSEEAGQFAHFYNTTYTAEDRLFLDKVMKEESLSGGSCPSTITGIPGRSTLVSAYVDLVMRKQLRFVWSAFFEHTEMDPIMKVFNDYRDGIRRNPLADVFLLVNKNYAVEIESVSLESDQLFENMLSGDQIMVRCGRLAPHYAIVWAVDRDNQRVLLLDPFDEFWQPSHNRCITFFDRKDYKYNRYLVHLSLSELKQMLIAVMTVRDRTSAN